MRRRTVATGIVTSIAVITVATGAAYGVLALSELTESTSRADAAVQAAPLVVSSPELVGETTTLSPKPDPAPVLQLDDQGIQVRDLQSRLDQLDFYSPKINGVFDRVTEQAVKRFQKQRKFDATGIVDVRTWTRLVKTTRKPTDDEMHNRMTPGPTILGPDGSGMDVRDLQARLKQIGWFSPDVTGVYGDDTTTAVDGFQAKREIPATGEVDQRTMDRLLAMTYEPTKDELFNRYPETSLGALDPRCKTGRVLCIDKSSNSLRWVVDGSVQMTLEVRFGSAELPTDEGQFSVNYKSRDHVSSLYNTSMPLAMFFSGGQAVHYSPDFAANGYNGASHGCVNVRDYAGISSLFDQVGIGDKVVVYWS